jgi:hypothetical protein
LDKAGVNPDTSGINPDASGVTMMSPAVLDTVTRWIVDRFAKPAS